MILVDINLLVYASDRGSPHHEGAKAWLDGELSASGRVGLPWESLTGFMRLVTNPRFYRKPASVMEAWEQARRWLERDNVWIPTPGERHAEILGGLLRNLGGGAKLIPDAHLAALAIEHGLTLCTTDGDFARFEKLRWMNPLRDDAFDAKMEAS